jgi:hypothetical protein
LHTETTHPALHCFQSLKLVANYSEEKNEPLGSSVRAMVALARGPASADTSSDHAQSAKDVVKGVWPAPQIPIKSASF